jgi:hypothetical protein
MNLHVQRTDEGHVLAGDGPDVVLVNGFLAHLSTRTSLLRPDARTASTC